MKNNKYRILTLCLTVLILAGAKSTELSDFYLHNPTTLNQRVKEKMEGNDNLEVENNDNKDDLYTSNNREINLKNSGFKDESDEHLKKRDAYILRDDSSSVNSTEKAPRTQEDLNSIPEYSGKASVVINSNRPYFKKTESTKIYKDYSNLDSLNRVGVCDSVIGPETLPKGKRGDISNVYPTGWNQKKYKFIEGHYLYNRCHLIGYQLAGDNDDWKNLITGTRYMNVEGMLPYENKVAEYIRSTKHHVRYRVTPVFENSNKLANGVYMEAYSIEDDDLIFNVFCYNVQPNVKINYKDGSSRLVK